jgi:hypothetical protein
MDTEINFISAVGDWADTVAEGARRAVRRITNDLAPGDKGDYLNPNLFSIADLINLRSRVFRAEAELSLFMGKIADHIDALNERP